MSIYMHMGQKRKQKVTRMMELTLFGLPTTFKNNWLMQFCVCTLFLGKSAEFKVKCVVSFLSIENWIICVVIERSVVAGCRVGRLLCLALNLKLKLM